MAYLLDVIGWRRRAVRETDLASAALLPWPMYAALAAAMLHELVDFSLQIPALGVILGLLAGVCAPPLRGRPALRAGLVPVVLGLALTVPALAHSAVTWPVVNEVVRVPDRASPHHARAVEKLRAWQANAEDTAAACEGLGEAVRARILRPLEARYMLTHARLLIATAERAGIPASEQERVRGEARGALEQSRVADPWDAFNREGVMNAAFALGDLDKAAEDALAVTTVNPEQSATIVAAMLEMGIPVTAIQQAMARNADTMRGVLVTLFDKGDFADAARIVPADIAPDAQNCRNAWLISRVLQQGHRVPAGPYLEGCLRVPAVRNDESLAASIAGWFGETLIEQRRFEEAAPWIAKANPGALRTQLEMRLAEHRGAWKDVIALGERLLREKDVPTDPRAQAWYHLTLAVAYAHEEKLGPAREELIAARELDPTLAVVDRMLGDISIGKNPVR